MKTMHDSLRSSVQTYRHTYYKIMIYRGYTDVLLFLYMNIRVEKNIENIWKPWIDKPRKVYDKFLANVTSGFSSKQIFIITKHH